MTEKTKNSTTQKTKKSPRKKTVKKAAPEQVIEAVKVKGWEDVVRDVNTNAILATDNESYQQAVRRKRQALTNKRNDNEIKRLKIKFAKLQSMVETIINNST